MIILIILLSLGHRFILKKLINSTTMQRKTIEYKDDVYELQKPISSNRNKAVHKARHKNYREMAIKLIPISSQTKQKIKDMRNYSSQNQSHINLVKIYKEPFVSEIYSSYYFCIPMEFCHGKTLKEYLQSHIKPLNKKKLMLNIAEGLQHFHKSANIPHKNIKPENILLFQQKPKITPQEPKFVLESFNYKSRSRQNLYVPPQFNQKYEIFSYQYDIWSLGVVFLEIMQDQLLNRQRQKMGDKIEYISEFVQNISIQDIKKIIKGMLQRDPHKRLKLDTVVRQLKEFHLEFSMNKQGKCEEKNVKQITRKRQSQEQAVWYEIPLIKSELKQLRSQLENRSRNSSVYSNNPKYSQETQKRVVMKSHVLCLIFYPQKQRLKISLHLKSDFTTQIEITIKQKYIPMQIKKKWTLEELFEELASKNKKSIIIKTNGTLAFRQNLEKKWIELFPPIKSCQ